MDELFILLSEQIYNIKDKIKDNEYLEIMNTLNTMYNLQKENYSEFFSESSEDESDSDENESDSDEDKSESDQNYQLHEINYQTDIVYSKMFEEYICQCNTQTCQCLCMSSFNLFRYCKNYEKIVNKCQNLQYIMNLHFNDINNEYKMKFTKNICVNYINNSYSEFIEIGHFLINFSENFKGYIHKYFNLIICNFFIENLYHVINTNLIFALYDKINEIIRHDKNIYIETFSDILIENDESIELLHNWLNMIKPYIAIFNEI